LINIWSEGNNSNAVNSRPTDQVRSVWYAHLFTSTAKQARPLIMVERTTRWSRVTIIILPRTCKTANKQGPLQFAVHLPEVLILKPCRRGSAVLKYWSGSSTPTNKALPCQLQSGYVMQIVRRNDVTRIMIMTKIFNKRSRYVPLCKK
jgi:hypothetical protein